MKEYEKKMAAYKKEALKVAKGADIVLFIGGNNREVETEGSDRTTIQLPFQQDELLKAPDSKLELMTLENDPDAAAQLIPHAPENPGGFQHHGGMGIVTAGVHDTGIYGFIG